MQRSIDYLSAPIERVVRLEPIFQEGHRSGYVGQQRPRRRRQAAVHRPPVLSIDLFVRS